MKEGGKFGITEAEEGGRSMEGRVGRRMGRVGNEGGRGEGRMERREIMWEGGMTLGGTEWGRCWEIGGSKEGGRDGGREGRKGCLVIIFMSNMFFLVNTDTFNTKLSMYLCFVPILARLKLMEQPETMLKFNLAQHQAISTLRGQERILSRGR